MQCDISRHFVETVRFRHVVLKNHAFPKVPVCPCLSSDVLPVSRTRLMLHLRVITRCGAQIWLIWQYQLYMSLTHLRHSFNTVFPAEGIQRSWNAVLPLVVGSRVMGQIHTCECRECCVSAESSWLGGQGNEGIVSCESLRSPELHRQFITAGKGAESGSEALPRNPTHNGRIQTAHTRL